MHFVAYEQSFLCRGARRLAAVGFWRLAFGTWRGRIALHAELFPFYSTAYTTVFGRGVPTRINAATGFWRSAAGVPAREVALKFFSLGIEVYPFACEVHPFVAEVYPAV